MNTKTAQDFFLELIELAPRLGTRIEMEDWEETGAMPSLELGYVYFLIDKNTRLKVELVEKKVSP